MTDPPQGRDGTSPSVAALAVQVETTRQEVETLTGQVTQVASAQRRHALLLDGVAELRQQIDHIHALLSGEGSDEPAPWFWLTMSDQVRAEKLAELTDWVESILRAQYPSYLADVIRPCWPNHLEARWELAWLYQLWLRAYLSDHSAVRDAADWHDRWAPGMIRRLSSVMRRCDPTCLSDLTNDRSYKPSSASLTSSKTTGASG